MNPIRRKPEWAGIFVLVVLSAAAVLIAGKATFPELGSASRAALRQRTGQPQFVRTEPLPAVDGMECVWRPASAPSTLAGSLQQSGEADSGSGAPASVAIDREPIRAIRDTYPTYSAVAVDLNSNEVYLQDENLFGYKVFDRLANTPPGAEFSEPKRMVGGPNTKLEFNCALYVDPTSGDVYSVNNDTLDTLTVFPREARGDVAPMRELHTPHGTYGIAVDEAAQEMFLTVQHMNGVVVYPKTAAGEDQPIRR
ncbi:MAG: hypothetical protein V3T65_08555, partial [Acidobacteriota bacterium]